MTCNPGQALLFASTPMWSASHGSTRLELIQGDITTQKVDAIVNSANEELKVGSGVDRAIHEAGGPAILRELREKYVRCPTGSALITGAGKLPAKYVIHAVGPFWLGGDNHEEESLASAYRESLRLAISYDCRSIAFPSISTGAYCYPVPQAAAVAIGAITTFAQQEPSIETIRLVLFNEGTFETFLSEAKQLSQWKQDS